jgi:hypothetical protein
MASRLKLILIHQESRCTEKLNIVKFRAPFGEAGLHKKGQTVENCLQNVQHTPATITVLSVEKNVQVEMVVEIWNNMKKCVEDQKSLIFVNIAQNNLNSIGL